MSLLLSKQSTKLIKVNPQLVLLNSFVRGKKHKPIKYHEAPERKYLVRENVPFLGKKRINKCWKKNVICYDYLLFF